jgi:hypothetical protein
MREFDTFKIDSVDTSGRAVYSVESFRPLTPGNVADAIIDSSLPRKESKTERFGLTYRFVEIFVPVQWKGFD